MLSVQGHATSQTRMCFDACLIYDVPSLLNYTQFAASERVNNLHLLLFHLLILVITVILITITLLCINMLTNVSIL